MRSKVMVLVVLTAAAVASPAHADLDYSISTSQVANGSNTTVSIYLTETSTKGSASLINPSSPFYDGGINFASLGVTLVPSSGSATITAVANNPALNSPAGSFPLTQINANSTAAGIVEATQGTPPSGTQIAPGVNQVLLGSVTVSGSGTFSIGAGYPGSAAAQSQNGPAPQVLTTATEYDLAFINNSQLGTPGDNGYPDNIVGAYDNGQTYSFTVGTVGVPEPSSMALCGLAIFGMGAGAWRRRKAKLAAEVGKVEEVAAI